MKNLMKTITTAIKHFWNIGIASLMLILSMIMYFEGDKEAGRHLFLVSMAFMILSKLDLIHLDVKSNEEKELTTTISGEDIEVNLRGNWVSLKDIKEEE